MTTPFERGLVSGPDEERRQARVSRGELLVVVGVGATMLELSRRLRGGRVALAALAVIVVAIGLAWVPWHFEPDPIAAMATGSSSGDGRFTVLVCAVAVIVLVGLAVQPLTRLRRAAIMVLATCLCLGAVEDLQLVLDISRRGGHSDAGIAAAVTPLSSWLWAAIWMLLGIVTCVLATWAAVGREPPGPAEGRTPE